MTLVYCTFRQPGFHCWPKAPEEFHYLRDMHRHEFHVRLEAMVNHDDRDVEFIHLKRIAHAAFIRLGTKAAEKYDDHLVFGEKSCERLADELANALKMQGILVASVTVSEDGENGARIIL